MSNESVCLTEEEFKLNNQPVKVIPSKATKSGVKSSSKTMKNESSPKDKDRRGSLNRSQTKQVPANLSLLK